VDDLSIPNPGYRGARAGRYGTGQQPARPGMDPDMRRMAMFAGGVGTVLVLLIGASALTSRPSGEVPVVTADARPLRVKPENAGGMKVLGADSDVFSGGSDAKNVKLAPAAETPNTKAWQSASTTPAPAAEASAPATVAPPPPVKPAAVAVAPPPSVKPAIVATSKVAPAPPPPKPMAATPPAAAVSRSATVQLAALSSEQAARGEWEALSKRMPDLLGSRQPSYSRTDRNGRTFWRVRTAGFTDVAQARGFCEKVRAKGVGCSVAEF
jgi:cell division septation protein DedD